MPFLGEVPLDTEIREWSDAGLPVVVDLVAGTPGEKLKWVAAAKSAGLLAEAYELARTSPCDPKTLTQAARDFAASKPEFESSAGLAALQWILRDHAYDLTSQYVADDLSHTLEAAQHHGNEAETVHTINLLVDPHPAANHTVVALLHRRFDDLTKR